MLSTAELAGRPSRPPDHEAENRALISLAQSMATSPEGILQTLADTALNLCGAHSAGLSLLEDGDQRKRFHWRAIAGQWSPHRNGGTPRDFGPCGTVLDLNVPLICSHPELDFPYWNEVKPVLEEGLLIPFYINGEAVGTIWVVAHDMSRRFDLEDLRVMNSLGTFAASAYQTLLYLEAAQKKEDQIATLAREAEHRAKNVLATVQATVHLSHADTAEGLKLAIEGRIQALANVHRLFVESRWSGAELHSVVSQELLPYCRDGEMRGRIDGTKLMLDPNSAQTIAVTLHELATNAAKYGAFSVSEGRVLVAWSRGEDGRLVLRWTETGGPPVKPAGRKGFGMRVMENMIRQMNGQVRFDWRAEGLQCEIAIPT